MTTNSTPKNSTKISIAIGLLCVFCLIAPGVVLSYFNAVYIISAIGAIIALTIAFLLPIGQKRISVYALGALLIGILFLTGSIIEFTYDIAPEHWKLGAIQPDEIGWGLVFLGVGITYLLTTSISQLISIKFSQWREIPELIFGKQPETPENLAAGNIREPLKESQIRALETFALGTFWIALGIGCIRLGFRI